MVGMVTAVASLACEASLGPKHLGSGKKDGGRSGWSATAVAGRLREMGLG